MTDAQSRRIIEEHFPGADILSGPHRYKNMLLYTIDTNEIDGHLDNVYGVLPDGSITYVSVLSDIAGITNALSS